MKERTHWLSSQLAKANKVLRPLLQGDGPQYDEARALADMLDASLEAQAAPGSSAAALDELKYQQAAVEQQQQGGDTSMGGDSAHAEQFQLSAPQTDLVRKLNAKGLAAGWVIDPSEVSGSVGADEQQQFTCML